MNEYTQRTEKAAERREMRALNSVNMRQSCLSSGEQNKCPQDVLPKCGQTDKFQSTCLRVILCSAHDDHHQIAIESPQFVVHFSFSSIHSQVIPYNIDGNYVWDPAKSHPRQSMHTNKRSGYGANNSRLISRWDDLCISGVVCFGRSNGGIDKWKLQRHLIVF